ncbi:glycosyltransferase [Vibrio alginolyticus]|uniref:glycosyltransferase n=1 Tax=Vibrio alginolyticus TaxID=663 RepID=UPI003753EBE0
MPVISNVYGIVVLYNPEPSVVDNILTYAKHLKKLFVYDNSSYSNESMLRSLASVVDIEYLYNGVNDGLSYAFNRVIKTLHCFSDSWILTMDQDSYFNDDDFERFIGLDLPNLQNVGIISPLHITEPKYTNINEFINIEELKTVMTSGNLLNIRLHKVVGGFDEKYFIDCVDWEYCLKLNSKGFKVIRVNNIQMPHGLGEPITKKSIFTKKNRVVLNHNALRRYYITRNKLLIISQYLLIHPKVCAIIFLSIFREDLINIILYEEDRKRKLINYAVGIKDFMFKRFGKKNL